MLKFLLDNGALVDLENDEGETPLFTAVGYDNTFGVVRELLRRGANVNVRSCNNSTPLHQAATENKGYIVKLLLNNGANIATKRRHYIATALHTCETIANVRLLLSRGVDVDAQDSQGQTALHVFAKSREYCEIVTYLVENGCDVNILDSEGFTVLHYSATAPISWETRPLRTLLDHPSTNRNAQNHHGCTALHSSILRLKWKKSIGTLEEQGILDRITTMCRGGVALDIQNNDGKTALHLAAEMAPDSIVELLVKSGASLTAKDNSNKTPFEIAASKSRSESIGMLLLPDGQPAQGSHRNDRGDTLSRKQSQLSSIDNPPPTPKRRRINQSEPEIEHRN
ncbi:ankyrin [Wilcoxina mikolae CBS 423.85]|nr:ankyrin [Wilcoxina mikolae CBS 423.85]